MTGQTEGAPAPALGPSNGGCAFSLFCGGVGAGGTVNIGPRSILMKLAISKQNTNTGD